jgi:hypothetical protein
LINIGGNYVEECANVTDNSGDTIYAVITGSVDNTKLGDYIISYDAIDASDNQAVQVQRTVKVTPIMYMYTHAGCSPTESSGQHLFLTDKNRGATWINSGDHEYSPSTTDYSNGFSIAFTMTTNNKSPMFSFNEGDNGQGIGVSYGFGGIAVKNTDGEDHSSYLATGGSYGFANGGHFTFLYTITRTEGLNSTSRLYKDGNLLGEKENVKFDPENVSRSDVTIPGWGVGDVRTTVTSITNIKVWNYPVDETEV